MQTLSPFASLPMPPRVFIRDEAEKLQRQPSGASISSKMLIDHGKTSIPSTFRSGDICESLRLSPDEQWDVAPEDVKLDDEIGRGAYGVVFSGLMKCRNEGSPGVVNVAVKVPIGGKAKRHSCDTEEANTVHAAQSLPQCFKCWPV